MKILEKRPLAMILCIMLGGFSFFADFDWKIKLVLASVPIALIALIFVFEPLKQGRKTITVVSLFALSVSFALSALWSFVFYPHIYYGENVSVTARVYEVDKSGAYSTKIVCKTEEINREDDKHTVIMYVDKELSKYVSKYDVISFNADVYEISGSDDGFDGKSYYVSRGCSALMDNLSELKILGNRPDRFDSIFKSLQLKISNRLKLNTDFGTGSFLSALIVGNRNDLSGNVKLNFARLGISHILALSGMHLAILSLAVDSLFKRLGIKKKLRVSIMIVLVIFYVALTGFSASVLRAGLMLIISSVLFLLSNKSDAITSLVMSVFIIVAFNPTAVFDLSLWLSAFATLGVIVFAEIAEKPEKDARIFDRMWISFKNGCIVSVFAFCATFAFTALRFDSFSIASIFTTLIFSFAIQFLIYAGMLILIFGRFLPIGKLVIAFSNAILNFAELISSVKFIYVSLNFFIVKLLIVLLTVFFFAFLLLDIKNKRKGILILLLLLVCVFTVAEIGTTVKRSRDDVIYSPNISGDVMLLKSSSEVSVIYSGRAVSNTGRNILDILTDEKLTYVDTLVFAGYSHTTIEFTSIIIDGIKVDRIMIPAPTTVEELGQAEGLSYLLSEYGAYLEFYDPLCYLDLGEYKYRLFDKSDYVYGMSPKNAFEVVLFDKRITYVSACEFESLSVSAKHLLYNCENLIIGSVSKSSDIAFEMLLPNVKQIYIYDEAILPQKVLLYYEEKGALTRCVKTPVSILN